MVLCWLLTVSLFYFWVMVRVVLGFEVHSGGGGGGSHGGDNGGGGGGGNRDGVESFSSHGYDVTNISSTRLHRKDRDGAG